MADQRPGDKALGESVPDQGATGIFGFVEDERKEAARPPISPAPALSPASSPDLAVTAQFPVASPTALEGAGFTQLLRALTNEVPASPVSASSAGPAFRSTADVMPSKPAPVAPSPGGFTAMFGALGDPGETVPPQPSPTGPPSSVSDGFTGAFGSVTPGSGSSSAAGPVFSSPTGSGRSSSIEMPQVSPGIVPVPAAYVPAPAAETQPAGEFTRLFQALDSKPAEAAPVFSSPISSSSVSAPAATYVPPPGSDSGGFTQLLRSFETGKGAATSAAQEVSFSPPPTAPRASAAPPASPPPESAGSFTQLFQALGPVSSGSPMSGSSSPTLQPQRGDDFTRSFSAFGASTPRNTSQADSFPPIAPSREIAPSYPVPDSGARAATPRYPDSTYAPPSPIGASASAGGSLEEMLRALDGPSKVPAQSTVQPFSNAAYEASQSYPTSVSREPAPSQSMLQNQYPYSDPGAAAMPKPQSAPGGMTSIINASQIREMERMARQGGAGAPPAAPAATPAAAAPALGAMPLQYPPVPGYPAMPSYPSTPNPGQGRSWPMPANLAPVAPPQVPQMPAPPALAAPQAGGAAKAWLPILLIVIIVLLVGILLAVLLMKK